MDSSIRLPGGLKVGIDGIVGLIPGVGDLLTTTVSSYIIVKAALLNAPASVLVRMSVNVLLDTLFGAIPLLGDIFDVLFRANLRNVELLEAHVADPASVESRSRLVILCILLLLLGLLALAVWLVISVLALLWTRIS